jgi:pyruvate/2-oxoglutarate dehydrogenase complex dihydrolipoamide acyltransferase (E2) component
VAVGSDSGLVVPVILRDAGPLGFADIEQGHRRVRRKRRATASSRSKT